MPLDGLALKAKIQDIAQREGFAAIRVTKPDAIPEAPDRLREWLAMGYQAEMGWMESRVDARASPKILWPEVRSILMLGFNYGPDHDPLAILGQKHRGAISVYAQGRDYHDIIKGKLKLLAQALVRLGGGEVKVFVDTAPVLEKALAEAAGLGWQGKHTVLVSRDLGNWLFLASLYTTLELPADRPETDHCGTCSKCLDICPTAAFPKPYLLDSRRCISYLTIEHKGQIPLEFREKIGNRIYGCDDCLAVCPWNKFAKRAEEAKFKAQDDLGAPDLATLAKLDEAAFRLKFRGSPIKRTGRNRFIRNVLIAIGNSGEVKLLEVIEPLLRDPSPLVSEMAEWARARLKS